MSSVKIQGNASGTGIFTIASPNSNTNRTLTLPDNTGTILTSATTTGFPAGSVIQVVNATYSTQTSTTSSTYSDTGLSASITPTSASSKILVIVHQTGLQKGAGDTNCTLRLLRGSTTILNFENQAGANGTSTSQAVGGSGCVYLDSPATTSSTTYKTQFSSGNNTTAVYVQLGNFYSSICLMEIAA